MDAWMRTGPGRIRRQPTWTLLFAGFKTSCFIIAYFRCRDEAYRDEHIGVDFIGIDRTVLCFVYPRANELREGTYLGTVHHRQQTYSDKHRHFPIQWFYTKKKPRHLLSA